MKLIVGLGNPGKEYEWTRHNVGFWAVDALAARFGMGVKDFRVKFQSLVSEYTFGGEKILMMKPQTYMNVSGVAVAEALNFYKIMQPDRDVMVIYDDMDFPVGTLKLRLSGSAGGHNGIKSLIAHMGTSQFARLRVGIGRPLPEQTVISHVLGRFPKTEEDQVKSVCEKAAEAVEYALVHSFQAAMNRYNS